ncbi:GSCFA domain-containing protein [Flavobacterium sp. LM5]|uniref:GSCFA domain-containing protein n=1 Tax=Flavobacterium sp. LM5 TaxID=1938610 RepID=UPI0009D06F46|nr:GSCFA domain-containing protein [Flavobacterium sp. LM5]OOV26913.1 GSCFA domain-containing protein [Flavobacterium sp. LM5]
MLLSTPISISKSNFPIDYQSKMVLMGSCFAENIGNKFQYFKFNTLVNPFGIIFNSVSIEKMIERVVLQKTFSKEDIFYHNERWHSYEVHSDCSTDDPEALLNNLNQLLSETKKQLQEATHFIITYGTSWVYRHIETNAIVANCHKVPQKQFTKELLSIDKIQKSIQNTISLIATLNPKCNFIFTVSPVRHLKDGFVENQVSKAHLIAAIHDNLKTEHLELNTDYFPSYEIMMDELRDYRFYADDMIHPSQLAIDYIWERFTATQIDANAIATMELVQTIQKGLAHRPFNPNSESHQKFEANLKEKIATLEAQYSFMKF